ncbi:MAG TPA: M36 family metallopeptidase [Saprospiraceae bacterium]|nr:M36 family metallopeptidase [Saprospiraceae bacterium]
MKNLKAKTEKRPGLGVPGRIYDIETRKQKGEPKKIADNLLKRIAPDLKIHSDLSQLKFDEVKETLLGTHVLYQQQEEGKPISGAWIRIDIDSEGKVYNIQNDLIPLPQIEKASKAKEKKGKVNDKQLTLAEATIIAEKAMKVSNNPTKSITDSELTWYTIDQIPILAWKIVISIQKPIAEWKFYVDAYTKKVLKKFNLLKSVNGRGKVFDPNPIVKLNGVKLKPNSKIPTESYIEVELKGLKNSGFLDGSFVSTKNTKRRVKKKDLDFRFTSDKRAFKEVMVYYHIDRVQRYIQELGFTNLMNKAILVDVDGETKDNSYYIPSSKSLQFGTGGVDDAEDAEIIIHEYAHAIQDAQVPGFGPDGESRAMGEGFGDYLAASFFANNKPSNFRQTFGTWDSYFTGTGQPKCLRRLDSNKKYPKDLVGEEHDDGEIWSSCLWQIRTKLGGKQTDKLVIAHHYLLKPMATFTEAANALILTDKNLNKGANKKMLQEVFMDCGILTKPKKRK